MHATTVLNIACMHDNTSFEYLKYVDMQTKKHMGQACRTLLGTNQLWSDHVPLI